MPELPEVETVRRGLEPVLVGRKLVSVTARRPDLRFALPIRFSERLMGRKVEKLSRRAKYMLAHLDSDDVLIMHLGMSGRFTIFLPGDADFHAKAAKHDHVEFVTDGGARIVYSDHRRFGMMDIVSASALPRYKFLAALGPEPLSSAFSGPTLSKSLRNKKTPIKNALLDQRVVAGLGNIYVCEALFRAGVSPLRESFSISENSAKKIVAASKRVLEDALRAGGSTLRDYKRTSGELGYFQNSFAVYGRENENCKKRGCRGVIKRIVQGGRSTFFCGSCQK